jgi:hypothetical protein
MNGWIHLEALLFGILTLALMAWPFYPAWREWRHPSDDVALEFSDGQNAWLGMAPAHRVGDAEPPTPEPNPIPGRAQRQLLTHLPHAQPWGDQGWRVQGDCHLPEDSCLPGPLVVGGKLTCGARSLIEGDVKVHGDTHLASDSILMGALFAHNVTLAEGAQVLGPVVARGAVRLGPHTAIARQSQPASLSAIQVLADDSACVYGPVWTQTPTQTPGLAP